MENCDLLCRPCHQFFTDHPFVFTQWITKKIGIDRLIALDEQANSPWDRDYLKVIQYLTEYPA